MAATACNIRVIVRADYYVTHGHDPDMEAMPGVEDITFQIEWLLMEHFPKSLR